ncbi:heparinase II/III domain-containing protein [Geminisphaera colitermitum]|uniref:heparinase II/III domain-containing protein n=1 Tax=Geminisphaera colitermitum TaxID=1148786 RepID=UPI0006938E69|nr:heparinase II/III family protein [Geminisphaera colitermitum]
MKPVCYLRFILLSVLGLQAFVLSAKPELVTREEAGALAVERLPEWRARISATTTPAPATGIANASHPRIYFTPDTAWQKNLRARRAAAQGREKELFDAVLEHARAIAAKPPVAYRPPEAWVTPKNALKSAEAELWQRPIGDNLVVSALALALEDDPAIRRNIRDVVLTACAYPSWGLRSRGMHLAAAHLSRGIAIATDWHPGIWTDAEQAVIRKTIRHHVNDIADGLHGGVFWALSYHNNHNHVSAAALGLCGLAFLDEIPEAARWLAAAQINFDRVIPANNADGSTPEGFSYWAYSLNLITQYIEGTRRITGSDTLYRHPFLRNAIAYRLHGSTPGFGGPLPWGAVGGTAPAPAILHALARQYRSTEGQFLARQFPCRTDDGITSNIAWQSLWFDPTLPATPPVILDYHATVSDIVTTRTGWTKNDYLLSIKSGVNNRNHGHLDAGALALAFGDEWLLTAPRYGQGKRDNTGGYWDRTTGRRWTYFSTTTEAHSTLLIDGKNQRSDSAARGTIDSFITTPAWCWTSVDLTQAYQDIDYARRGVLHRRGDYILVFDNVHASRPLIVEWLAQLLPKRITPPSPPSATTDRLHVGNKTGSLEIRALYPARLAFAPRAPTAPNHDLPGGRLETYALKSEGNNIRYVTALLPAFAATSGKQNPVRDITVQEIPGGLQITLHGDGWTDTITQSDTDPRHLQAARTDEPTFKTTRP